MAVTNGNRSLTLSDKQIHVLLVAQLHELQTSMKVADEYAGVLAELSATNPAWDGAVDDMMTSVNVLRDDLDALDALGWPK